LARLPWEVEFVSRDSGYVWGSIHPTCRNLVRGKALEGQEASQKIASCSLLSDCNEMTAFEPEIECKILARMLNTVEILLRN
jgi:hypothetical protein